MATAGRPGKGAARVHEQLLAGVHIAHDGDALGQTLAAVDERSRQSMAQQALRWTYLLRSRQRWVREAKVRKEAPAYLTACGLAMRRFLQ